MYILNNRLIKLIKNSIKAERKQINKQLTMTPARALKMSTFRANFKIIKESNLLFLPLIFISLDFFVNLVMG